MTSECGAGVLGEPVAVEIPPAHRAALRLLAERLTATNIVWALTGSTSFALQGVTVSVHDIDVQTDAAGAYRIAELFPQVVLRPVAFAGTERIQSHFGALRLGEIVVELMGALQKRLPDGTWEAPVDVRAHRRFVPLATLRLPVLDLAYEEQAYRLLGRVERADLLRRHLTTRRGTSASAVEPYPGEP